jgi:leucyl-tRNA synthetase
MSKGVKFADKKPTKTSYKDKLIISKTHKTIMTVTDKINSYEFNMAIRSMMDLASALSKLDMSKESYDYSFTQLIKLLAPYPAHLRGVNGNGLAARASCQ